MQSKPCIKSAAIIGAGPCGLATAIALRSKGIDVHIYEKKEGFKPAGVGTVLSHNGTYALRAIQPKIFDQLIQCGEVFKEFIWKSLSGEITRAVPVNEYGVYETPQLLLTWHDMTKILFENVPKDKIHFNHEFSHYEEEDERVNIYFTNQKKVQADIVIGTDGLNSTMRKLITGQESPISYVGQMSWQGLIPYKEQYAKPHEFYFILTPEISFSWVSTGKDVYWLFFKVSPKKESCKKSDILTSIANWPEPVHSIIKDAKEEAIIERPLYEVAPINRWWKGRAVIAGDAPHALMPTLGQGTSLSYEDAFELARCLSSYPTVDEAFAEYEKNRNERISCIQLYSEEIKKRLWGKSQTSDQVSKEYNKLFSDRWFFQWLFNYKVDKDYNLPNPLKAAHKDQ